MKVVLKRRLRRSSCISLIGGVLMISSSALAYVGTVPKGRFINQVFSDVTTTTGVKFGSNTNPPNNNAPVGEKNAVIASGGIAICK